jgi:hypothetical protein
MSKPKASGTAKRDDKRSLKGTTSRRQSALRNAALLLIPLIILIAAAARGLPSSDHGEVPDWQPSGSTAAGH